MNPVKFTVRFFAALLLLVCAAGVGAADLTLWYRQPAANWKEALTATATKKFTQLIGPIKGIRINSNYKGVTSPSGVPAGSAFRFSLAASVFCF
jgi:hypothetical protein